ncbi:MAG: glutathione S-transferase [Pseudomonadota bacterium]|nr:glutathione S-transferase [Pseudomonadota bacterium]
MQLVGLLDSPYVRRVAVSLQLLGLPFEHRPISVFRGYAQFAAINPVVKAPTLICDDGTVLMDSTLILDHAESLADPARRLMPCEPGARARALRVLGLALAAAEKSVQIVYEHMARPSEKLHQPWVDRVTEQLQAACGALESDLSRHPLDVSVGRIDQAGLTTAVVWHFIQSYTPDAAPSRDHPLLEALSAAAEQLPQFRWAPHGEAPCHPEATGQAS